VAATFAAAIPPMAAVTYPVYHLMGVSHARRGTVSVLMSVPGLFLDALLFVFAATVFPAMEPGRWSPSGRSACSATPSSS
jgi:hypothetical protein